MLTDSRKMCIVHAMPIREHKPTDSTYDKKTRRSCIQCGQWLDKIEGRTRWYGYEQEFGRELK